MKKKPQSSIHPIIQSFKRAFTLVEILTVVFLGSVIIMTAYSVYLMSYKSYKKQSESAELTQNARIALERMSREIRQTNEIFTPSSSEIKFRDGHTLNPIQYINYYRNNDHDLNRKVTHFYCSNDSNTWVLSTTNCVPPNTLEEDETALADIKAQKITALQFSVNSVVTINLTVSDETTTYKFETKTLARNL